MIFNVYQIYSRKSIIKNRIVKYASAFSVILAVAIMVFMQIVLDAYQDGIHERIQEMNGSNVKILDKEYLEHKFTDSDVQFIKDTIGKSNCIFAYSDISNIIANGTEDAVAMTILERPDVQFLSAVSHLNIGEVAISSQIAKRLNLKIGDEIFLKLHSKKYQDGTFKVAQILNDNLYFSVAGNEYEIAQETLGCVYVVLPEYDTFNTAFLQETDAEKIDTLKAELIPSFEVRTTNDLFNIVVPKIEIQVSLLKLISSLAVIISSICLAWSFLVLILNRKEDFIIFKKIGMRTSDLSKLLLLEIYTMVIKGIIIGIPFGSLIAIGYLQRNNRIDNLNEYTIIRDFLVISFLVLLQVGNFSLIPIDRVKKIIKYENKELKSNIPMGIKLVVFINIVIISCIYVKSFIGVAFGIGIGIIFLIFYSILNGLMKIVLIILSIKKNKNFLLIDDMKRNSKVVIFSLNIVNIFLVFLFILLSALPMLYSPIEDGRNEGMESVTYRTSHCNINLENFLKEKGKIKEKYYTSNIKINQINNINISECINPDIADIYKSESILELSERKINIYEDALYKGIESQNGIYINNIYKNMYNFKEGDLIAISFDNTVIQCKIVGIYEDTNNKDIIGIVSEAYMKSQGIDPAKFQMPITYILNQDVDNDIIKEILYKDKTAYIDKNQDLSNYFKAYIDKQKEILVNNIVAVGFASCLLVFLGQIILFAQKRDYYIALWKVGMGKDYLIMNLLLEKIILSVIQIIIINIFLEPIRFLINAEMGQENYSVSGTILLIEFCVVFMINIFSIIFPFITKKNINQ